MVSMIVALPKITGSISAVCSVYVIVDVLRNPKKRKESVYHRVMVGLSASDIIVSITWTVSTWLMPAGHFPSSVGTLRSCDAIGFLNLLSNISTPMYNCSLATFYLYQLKKNLPQSEMKRKEKWLHIIPWVSGVIPAIFGLATNLYGPYGVLCMTTNGYPRGCGQPNTGQCERGDEALFRFILVFFLVSYIVSLAYVTITMFRVYRSVYSIEKKAEKYSFRNASSSSKSRRSMSKRILMQGILYGVGIFLTLIFPLIQAFFVGKSAPPVTIRILNLTFQPLQGFFNAIIYSIPGFIKWKRDRDASVSSERWSLSFFSKNNLSGILNRSKRSNPRWRESNSQHEDACSNPMGSITTSSKEKKEKTNLLTNGSNDTQNCKSAPQKMINIDYNATDAENGLTKTTNPKQSSESSEIESNIASHEEFVLSQADADETDDKCKSLVADDSLQDTLYASKTIDQDFNDVMAAPRRKLITFKEEEDIVQKVNELTQSNTDCGNEHSEEGIVNQLTFHDEKGHKDCKDDYLTLLQETHEPII